MKSMPGPSKLPFRGGGIHPKRVLLDHVVEPEYTIPTEDNFTNALDQDVHVFRYDPRVHAEGVKQWVNKTRPVRQPFEGDAFAAAASPNDDSLPVRCESAPSVSAADTDSLEEAWRQREFERVYAQLAHQYELQQQQLGDPHKLEARKIADRVNRYKRAFLKGFFEARIRRVQANKWLYERLHVNAEHIKDKYQQLMYASEPKYEQHTTGEQERPQHHKSSDVNAEANAAAPDVNAAANVATAALQPMHVHGGAETDQPKENDREALPQQQSATEQRTCDQAAINELDDLEAEAAGSVYSFTPERDAVLLQDVNSPPQIRGFGRDRHRKYDPRLRLLHLEHWVSPDIEQWMNERRLNEAAASDNESEHRHHHYPRHRRHQHYIGDEEMQAPKEDLKYEEIRGATELPTWLGPKRLDEPELDLETFRKLSIDNGDTRSVLKDENDERKAPVADGVEKRGGGDDAASQASKAVSETPSKGLLRQLVQSHTKDNYKLWYATHDTYNTTPFLEARLQRLMREIFGRREWAVYRDYLKTKQEGRRKHRVYEGLLQQ